jgi:putative inorganic carbon (hco3(-)) transporter
MALAFILGTLMIVLIRLAPLHAVIALTVVRASLEGLSDHVIVRPLGLQLSVPDLITVALLIGGCWWLVSKVVAGSFDWGIPTLLPTLLFLSVATLSLLYSSSWTLGARDIFKFAGAYCAFLIIMQSRPDSQKLRLLLTLVAFSAVLPICVGWYQFTHSIGKPGEFHGGLRIQATFDHPNTYGFFLVSILAAIWGLLRVVEGKRRGLVVAIGISAFVSIFMTLSRNTWGALGILVLVVGYRHRRILLGVAMATVGVIVVMPRTLTAATSLASPRSGSNRGSSLLGRIDLWTRDINFWRTSPILGHGWGTTQVETGSLDHNDFLRALVEGGILGFLTYVVFMISIVRAGWASARGRTDLPLSFFGLSLGYLSVSAASNNFGKGAFQFYFWVIAAISLLWTQLSPPASNPSSAVKRAFLGDSHHPITISGSPPAAMIEKEVRRE